MAMLGCDHYMQDPPISIYVPLNEFDRICKTDKNLAADRKLKPLKMTFRTILLLSCHSMVRFCRFIKVPKYANCQLSISRTCTPLKFNIAPEKLPSQKENSLPTTICQGLC